MAIYGGREKKAKVKISPTSGSTFVGTIIGACCKQWLDADQGRNVSVWGKRQAMCNDNRAKAHLPNENSVTHLYFFISLLLLLLLLLTRSIRRRESMHACICMPKNTTWANDPNSELGSNKVIWRGGGEGEKRRPLRTLCFLRALPLLCALSLYHRLTFGYWQWAVSDCIIARAQYNNAYCICMHVWVLSCFYQTLQNSFKNVSAFEELVFFVLLYIWIKAVYVWKAS
jgi:hypothetical protein